MYKNALKLSFFFFLLLFIIIIMFFSKRNTTLYLFLLLAILGTFLADAAPIGSVDGNSATITCNTYYYLILLFINLFNNSCRSCSDSTWYRI